MIIIANLVTSAFGCQDPAPSTLSKTPPVPAKPNPQDGKNQIKAWENLKDISELSQVPLPPDVEKKLGPGISIYQKSTNGTANVDFEQRMWEEELSGPPTTGAYLTAVNYNRATRDEIYSLLATDPSANGQPVSLAGRAEFTMYRIDHKQNTRLVAFYRIIKFYKNNKLIEQRIVLENFHRPSS
jgi:hypothetical protein